MAEEIEVKILGIDKPEVIARLESLGAELVLPKTRFYIFEYDFSDYSLRKRGAVCRVRSEGSTAVWCYKAKTDKDADKDGFKVRHERQVVVSNLEESCRMLEDLGMKCVTICEKDRTSYSFGNAKVDIDELPCIPLYAEVEAPAKDVVERAVKQLGYKMSQTSTKSWKDVVKSYGVNVDEVPLIIRF